MKEMPKIYIITKITDLSGNDRIDGRYPLRIGRRFAFGLGEPHPFTSMAICYRPRQNDNYTGTLRTSTVQKITRNEKELIVKTQNSIYYFKEEE